MQFVLLVGDSHLRAIADGFVAMPDGALSFGVLSIPGASAAELRTEVLNVVLPRTPEAVCLLGPSNNLCSSRTVSEAGADFGRLLKSVCGTWPSVHLSDDAGMEILARLVWAAASQQLERATRVATVQRTSPRTSPPARRVSPKVVVMDEVAVPRPSNPFEWTVVGRTTKTAQPETPPPAPSPWTKKDAITPSQSPAQKVAVPRPSNPFEWTVVGRTTKTAQPETPPPAPSPWTKKDAITPSQSPAQKMARLPIAALAAPVVGRTKKTAQPETPPPAPSLWTKKDAITPSQSPAQKFVLLVGDSHLRAIADGFVAMPDGALSFGVLSIPGASAAELRTEVLNVVLPRTPEAVCLLGPSNNLCSSRTVSEAGADFGRLLKSVCGTWPSGNVFVLDFPPRLNIDVALQDLLRQEYHRVAARMATGEGDSGCNGAEDFSQDITTCQKGLSKSGCDGREPWAYVQATGYCAVGFDVFIGFVFLDSPARDAATSPFTLDQEGCDHPSQSPAQKFVLLVGDSHLRAIADGFVAMPDGALSFGVLSIPGASAAELRTETAQPETPPPAPSPWTKKDAITPSQSPAQKMARLPIAALAAPVVGRTKKVMDCTTLGYCAVGFDVFIGFVFLDSPARDAATSPFTLDQEGCDHPSQSPAQKFVLLVGDSHLRAIADGFVAMPDGALSFGVLSIPGASAAELRTEVLNVVLPRTPEAVCLLGPSNNLCSSRTVSEAGADFGRLLKSVCGTWPSVHLSDDAGMEILARLVWAAASQQLERATRVATERTSPRTSPPARRVSPKVVVMDEVAF
ncbi:hypothetical protein AAFF_G00192910 [Aldrovandia affinis]|uniref:Uncharacterized protein n=1 Tax=Aldrovandia affinis TaxID=143900 RepID=A0AAD7R045_9TELE|nr:hypothetical protein AAFF_G00192910 [Aldrovandia affinis]